MRRAILRTAFAVPGTGIRDPARRGPLKDLDDVLWQETGVEALVGPSKVHVFVPWSNVLAVVTVPDEPKAEAPQGGIVEAEWSVNQDPAAARPVELAKQETAADAASNEDPAPAAAPETDVRSDPPREARKGRRKKRK